MYLKTVKIIAGENKQLAYRLKDNVLEVWLDDGLRFAPEDAVHHEKGISVGGVGNGVRDMAPVQMSVEELYD